MIGAFSLSNNICNYFSFSNQSDEYRNIKRIKQKIIKDHKKKSVLSLTEEYIEKQTLRMYNYEKFVLIMMLSKIKDNLFYKLPKEIIQKIFEETKE